MRTTAISQLSQGADLAPLRESIEKAAAAGRPLMESYMDRRTGREHQRRRRSLSNDSINKVLAGFGRC